MINGELYKKTFLSEKEVKYLRDKNPSPALFLDRDGVIIKENNHLSDPKRVKLEKGIKKILEYISFKNIPIIVITNQSGIYDKKYDWNDFNLVTKRMIFLLGQKVKISAIYANGENRNRKNLVWRKPSPKMILEAKNELNIDIYRSILVGDRMTDLKAGEKAEINNLIHIKTGHGEKERKGIINHYKLNKGVTLLKQKLNLIFLDTFEDLPLNTINDIFDLK